jgi:hypothetical protein
MGSAPRQAITVSVLKEVLEAVEAYRQRLDIVPSTSRAIERLIIEGLGKVSPQAQLDLAPRPPTSSAPKKGQPAVKARAKPKAKTAGTKSAPTDPHA